MYVSKIIAVLKLHVNVCNLQENYAEVQVADVGEDLEQVEVMQKKFDDFQADLKANEVRLAEMNEIAMQLMSLGQTEAALKIQTQIEVSTQTDILWL